MIKDLDLKTNITPVLIFAFLINTFGPLSLAQADEFRLPAPGVMVHLSPEFNPPILKGIKVHPDNPFRFDFILDKGDDSSVIASPSSGVIARDSSGVIASPEGAKQSQQEQLKTEATRLIKYFLASLTIPEKDLWVNLSPYEKNRIIPESFGQTEMGRDLLAEDYILKQITASLIYPEDEIGKKFWKRIYQEAAKKFGTTNIPVNTFNKVWIVPEKAVVYENVKAGTAYVVESKLKVMLEQDYLALSHSVIASLPTVIPAKAGIQNKNDINALGSQIVREIVIPELTKEVNEDKNFAQLRQVYNSLILATWYKKKMKDSLFSQVYEDKNKIAGVNIDDPQEKEKIYQRYLRAFKKGVFNYIKEEIPFGSASKQQGMFPRKYFSGGAELIDIGRAMIITQSAPNVFNNIGDLAMVSSKIDAAQDVMPYSDRLKLLNPGYVSPPEGQSITSTETYPHRLTGLEELLKAYSKATSDRFINVVMLGAGLVESPEGIKSSPQTEEMMRALNFARKGKLDVTVVDLSPDVINFVTHSDPNLRGFLGRFQDLEYGENQVDLIVATHSLYYFYINRQFDRDALFSLIVKLIKALKPSGRLLIDQGTFSPLITQINKSIGNKSNIQRSKMEIQNLEQYLRDNYRVMIKVRFYKDVVQIQKTQDSAQLAKPDQAMLIDQAKKYARGRYWGSIKRLYKRAQKSGAGADTLTAIASIYWGAKLEEINEFAFDDKWKPVHRDFFKEVEHGNIVGGRRVWWLIHWMIQKELNRYHALNKNPDIEKNYRGNLLLPDLIYDPQDPFKIPIDDWIFADLFSLQIMMEVSDKDFQGVNTEKQHAAVIQVIKKIIKQISLDAESYPSGLRNNFKLDRYRMIDEYIRVRVKKEQYIGPLFIRRSTYRVRNMLNPDRNKRRGDRIIQELNMISSTMNIVHGNFPNILQWIFNTGLPLEDYISFMNQIPFNNPLTRLMQLLGDDFRDLVVKIRRTRHLPQLLRIIHWVIQFRKDMNQTRSVPQDVYAILEVLSKTWGVGLWTNANWQNFEEQIKDYLNYGFSVLSPGLFRYYVKYRDNKEEMAIFRSAINEQIGFNMAWGGYRGLSKSFMRQYRLTEEDEIALLGRYMTVQNRTTNEYARLSNSLKAALINRNSGQDQWHNEIDSSLRTLYSFEGNQVIVQYHPPEGNNQNRDLLNRRFVSWAKLKFDQEKLNSVLHKVVYAQELSEEEKGALVAYVFAVNQFDPLVYSVLPTSDMENLNWLERWGIVITDFWEEAVGHQDFHDSIDQFLIEQVKDGNLDALYRDNGNPSTERLVRAALQQKDSLAKKFGVEDTEPLAKILAIRRAVKDRLLGIFSVDFTEYRKQAGYYQQFEINNSQRFYVGFFDDFLHLMGVMMTGCCTWDVRDQQVADENVHFGTLALKNEEGRLLGKSQVQLLRTGIRGFDPSKNSAKGWKVFSVIADNIAKEDFGINKFNAFISMLKLAQELAEKNGMQAATLTVDPVMHAQGEPEHGFVRDLVARGWLKEAELEHTILVARATQNHGEYSYNRVYVIQIPEDVSPLTAAISPFINYRDFKMPPENRGRNPAMRTTTDRAMTGEDEKLMEYIAKRMDNQIISDQTGHQYTLKIKSYTGVSPLINVYLDKVDIADIPVGSFSIKNGRITHPNIRLGNKFLGQGRLGEQILRIFSYAVPQGTVQEGLISNRRVREEIFKLADEFQKNGVLIKDDQQLSDELLKTYLSSLLVGFGDLKIFYKGKEGIAAFKQLISEPIIEEEMVQSFDYQATKLDSAMTARRQSGVNVEQVDRQGKGGIDLTADKTPLEIQNAGGGIKFHLDPAMLAQLQNAPGFTPMIITIQPMTNLRSFLGLADNQSAPKNSLSPI